MKVRFLLAFGILASLSACKDADSVVFVNVSITPDAPPVYSLRVAMSTTRAHDTKIYPAAPSVTAILSPSSASSFAIVLPRSRTGFLDLALDGLDTAGKSVAHGTAQTTIVVGGTVTVPSVVLVTGSSLCGDGVVDSGETCDDGNQFSFDGCDFQCRIEGAPSDASVPDVDAFDGGDSNSRQDSMVDLAAPDTSSIADSGADISKLGTGGAKGAGGATGAGGASAGAGGATSGPDGGTSTGGSTGSGGMTGAGGGAGSGGATGSGGGTGTLVPLGGACSLSSQCANGYCANKTCTAKLGNGTSCGGADQCGSAFCTDGVCCVVSKCVDTCVPSGITTCAPYSGFTCAPYGTCRGY
jgi:cysteine-rich repeat protein